MLCTRKASPETGPDLSRLVFVLAGRVTDLEGQPALAVVVPQVLKNVSSRLVIKRLSDSIPNAPEGVHRNDVDLVTVSENRFPLPVLRPYLELDLAFRADISVALDGRPGVDGERAR